MVAGVWDFEESDRSARILMSPFQPLAEECQESLMLEARCVLHIVHPQRRHEVAMDRVS